MGVLGAIACPVCHGAPRVGPQERPAAAGPERADVPQAFARSGPINDAFLADQDSTDVAGLRTTFSRVPGAGRSWLLGALCAGRGAADLGVEVARARGATSSGEASLEVRFAIDLAALQATGGRDGVGIGGWCVIAASRPELTVRERPRSVRCLWSVEVDVRNRRQWVCSAGLVIAASWAAAGCGEEDLTQEEGHCYLRQTVCEGCESTEEHKYCTSESKCGDYCAVMSGRPTTAYCYWADEGYCSGDLPEIGEGSTVCAIQRTFSCGGGEVSSEPICDATCAHPPGSNDYSPETDCLTEYGSTQGRGKTCEEALADLASR